MLYFRHQSSLEHDPALLSPEHPDTPERIGAVEGTMERLGWLGCEVRDAPAATEPELGLVHARSQIIMIHDLCAVGGGQIDADTYVGESSYEAALYAAGGACELVRALVRGEDDVGFSALRPSGHHAGRDYAMGFCLFNNVAIAAELAIHELGVQRVLILDWDVHHGNGTAHIFRHRSDVLFASVHQRGLFPWTGAGTDSGSGDGLGYTINVPVPPGSGEAVWMSALEHVILPAALEFGPQLVLISAGFDAHRDDPLGGCELESSSFAQMARRVRELALAVGAPVGAVLEGGYHPPALAESVAATVAALSGVGTAEPTPAPMG
ncbi:MAG TPA: histone deacetylase [Solirubrobacteraceae bacterium]|nr:histone deacetylase [Solirubrobacteraceae bacterium]